MRRLRQASGLLVLLFLVASCTGGPAPPTAPGARNATTANADSSSASARVLADIDFTVTSDWGTGFGAAVTVHNPDSAPLTNWTLEFDFAPDIQEIWNARVQARAGERYRIVPEAWNATIPAGGTVSFGFNGAPGHLTDRPRNVVVSSPTSSPGPTASATSSPTASPSPPASPSSSPPTGLPSCDPSTLVAAAQVINDWGSGQEVHLTIHNAGASEVSDWRLQFTYGGTVSSMWNAHVLNHAGSTITVAPESWNSTLAAGASLEVGYIGAPGGLRPTALTACAGSATSSPSPTPTPTTSPTPSATTSPTPSPSPTSTASPSASPTSTRAAKVKVAAYFPEWGIYQRNYNVSDIPADRLDAVIYAFADVSEQGEMVIYDRWAAVDKPFPGDAWDQPVKGNFHQLQLLKQQHPDLKVLVAVGGWTLSARFPQVAATPASRTKFADSALAFCRTYGFDGVDVDWEYPGPADRQNFSLLLAALRSRLQPDGRYLTAALPAGAGNVANLDLPSVSAALDWINLMTYDYHGGWESTTGHLAPLYARDGLSVEDTVRLYLAGGVPAAQIRLGMPAYGRSWVGASGLGSTTAGVGQGTWDDTGMFDYQDLVARLASDPATYRRNWDSFARVPYLLTPTGTFITYDDAASALEKLDYARSQGLGGVMLWELSSDLRDPSRPESLLGTLSRVVRSWP